MSPVCVLPVLCQAFRLALLLAILPIAACVQNNSNLESRFADPVPRIVGDSWTPEQLKIANPRTATVVVYSHGTRRPQQYDNCEAPGYTLPPVLARLDGGDVQVMRHCSAAIEPRVRETAGKQVFLRAEELLRLVKGLTARGVSPQRIYLAGNSNGGWSSLMAYARDPEAFAGVVAFAPAFAGPRSEESLYPWWRQVARPKQVKLLEDAAELNALVFAYEGDRFNRPQELAFLPEAHPDTVRLIAYGCGNARPHGTYRRDCREDQTLALIRDYIRQDKDVPVALLQRALNWPAG